MKVKIKKINPKAVIPEFATKGAACMDLVVTHIDTSHSKMFVLCHLGFSTEIPIGYKACFAPRSSFTHKGWVMANSPAQIDSDYRGEWMIKFEAIPNGFKPAYSNGIIGPGHKGKKAETLYSDFPYKVGDRVAQMWLEKVVNFEFEEVEELSSTERGDGGFGSTNK